MAKSVTSEKIKLTNVRLAFPNLWVPKAMNEGQAPRFDATFLLDPTDAAHAAKIKELKAAIKDVATRAWPNGIPDEILSGEKVCLKNNVYTDSEGTVRQRKKYNGYKDMYFLPSGVPAVCDPDPKTGKVVIPRVVRLMSGEIDYYVGQPPVVGRSKQPVREGQPEAPFPGSRVNGVITFWSQDNQWGRRVNCNLVAVQYNAPDDPFTRGGVDIDEAFDAIEDAETPAVEGGTPKAAKTGAGAMWD